MQGVWGKDKVGVEDEYGDGDEGLRFTVSMVVRRGGANADQAEGGKGAGLG